MADSNLQNAIGAMKTKIRAEVGGADVDNVLKLSRAAKNTGLDTDGEVEGDFNIRALSLSTTATAGEVDKLSRGIKKLITRDVDTGGVSISSSDDVPAGSTNQYFSQSGARGLIQSSGDVSYNSVTGEFSFTAPAGGLTVYTNSSELPLSGNNAGDQALVTSTNRLYIFTGSGWYSVPVS